MGRTFLSRAYCELLTMSQLVTDSPLDWTIARFTRPTDGARTGTVRAGYLGPTAFAPASPAPTSRPSCSTRAPTPASTAPHPSSAIEGSIPQLPPDFREYLFHA